MTDSTPPPTATPLQSVGARGDPDNVAVCACQLYDAECALHAARMSGVDAWIAAASHKLHVAVAQYRACLAGSAAALRSPGHTLRVGGGS